MTWFEEIWFFTALVVVMAHNTLFFAYCYRLEKRFPQIGEELGRPQIRNSSVARPLAFRIFRGKAYDIGDHNQASWVRLTGGISFLMVVPMLAYGVCAIAFSHPVK